MGFKAREEKIVPCAYYYKIEVSSQEVKLFPQKFY